MSRRCGLLRRRRASNMLAHRRWSAMSGSGGTGIGAAPAMSGCRVVGKRRVTDITGYRIAGSSMVASGVAMAGTGSRSSIVQHRAKCLAITTTRGTAAATNDLPHARSWRHRCARMSVRRCGMNAAIAGSVSVNRGPRRSAASAILAAPRDGKCSHRRRTLQNAGTADTRSKAIRVRAPTRHVGGDRERSAPAANAVRNDGSGRSERNEQSDPGARGERGRDRGNQQGGRQG